MFLGEDALGEGVLIVGGEDGNGFLQDDGAMVEMLVNKMNGAAAELNAVFERLMLRLKAGEGGEQGRVDIQDLSGELLDEPRREQAEVSG